jgi:hypothetical protein
MKTNKLTLLISILLMGAVFAAAGQPARGTEKNYRGNSNDKNRSVRIDKKKDYREYSSNRNSVRHDDRRSTPYRSYKPTPERRHEMPPHFKGNKDYRYIPKYGHTVKHFRNKPVILHANAGRYYYHQGHFYRYHKGIGYIWIDNPAGIVFRALPHGAVMVRINGLPYYRVGNVYFTTHPYGYEAVMLPARYYRRPVIHISASF